MAKKVLKKNNKREAKAKFVKYERVNAKAQKKFESLLKNDKNALAIFKQVINGKSVYVRQERKEDSFFDLSWIKKIEDCLPHIEKIIEHPKITTKTLSDVVPIELSRKINSQSVQHLASHAQYVKKVDSQGNVTPEKILNIFTEDEYVTYENRLVATLIRHLILFIGKRYEYLSKKQNLVNYETLYVKNVSDVNGSHLEIETKIKFSRETVDENGNSFKTYLARVKYMYDLVSTFNRTNFMRDFSKVRDIHPPLLRTNIIRKNFDYKACATLFTFINSYTKIGVNFTIKENYLKLSKEQEKYLASLNVLNFLSMNASPTVEPLVIREKQYEPKVLTKVDDDLFYYDNYGDQPEFIRADQTYYDDLKREISAEVKEKPKKEDIKVHKEAYKVKKEIDTQQRALDELKKRKEKERKAMLKEELRLAKAEADERRRKEEELRLAQEKAEEEMLNAARKHIVNSAKIDEEPLVEAVKKEEIEFKTKNKL